MGTCLLSNQHKQCGDLAYSTNHNFFLCSGGAEGGITQEFCRTSRKVAISVMCCEKQDALYICKCVGTRVRVWLSVARRPKACSSSFFFAEQRQKQRRYSSTFRLEGAQIECVTQNGEGDWRRGKWGGLEINAKARTPALRWSWLKPVFTVNFRPQCHA